MESGEYYKGRKLMRLCVGCKKEILARRGSQKKRKYCSYECYNRNKYKKFWYTDKTK